MLKEAGRACRSSGVMEHPETRCIECGGVVGSLNEDEDGVPGPACAERLLETLPGVFHAPWVETDATVGEGEVDVSVAESPESEEA